MAFQQMSELADGGFVGHRLPAQIDINKGAHRLDIVEGFNLSDPAAEEALYDIQAVCASVDVGSWGRWLGRAPAPGPDRYQQRRTSPGYRRGLLPLPDR